MTAIAEPAPTSPPRDNIFRSLPDFDVRAADTGMPTLVGHFTRFNEWTTIDSFWEGRFLERIAPGAFKKTFKEQKDSLRVLFQHGRDPQVGDKPLGPIKTLREEPVGPYYEVPMLDTEYNRELIPGLEAGLYGASFRMAVVREDIVKEPERSDHNPDGIPERTIKEIRLFEFGPVTFPAYPNATAGVRSLTDDVILEQLAKADPEKLRALVGTSNGKPDKPELRAMKDSVNDAQVKAATMGELIAAGFTPRSVVAAADSGDMSLLRHTTETVVEAEVVEEEREEEIIDDEVVDEDETRDDDTDDENSDTEDRSHEDVDEALVSENDTAAPGSVPTPLQTVFPRKSGKRRSKSWELPAPKSSTTRFGSPRS